MLLLVLKKHFLLDYNLKKLIKITQLRIVKRIVNEKFLSQIWNIFNFNYRKYSLSLDCKK